MGSLQTEIRRRMRQRPETPDFGPLLRLIGRTGDRARNDRLRHIDRLLHLKLDISSRGQLHWVLPSDLTMV
jgi:hypothetical protein